MKALRYFFSEVEKICSSGIRRDIFIYLLVNRASCAPLIQGELGVSQASVYRVLDSLVRLGLIVRIPPRREGRGRPYNIYAVKGYSPDDIVRALKRASWARTPAFPLVASIKQLIMEDYIQVRGLPEISWKEILRTTRAHCKGYYNVDIANMVARELGREGIKIWR